MILFFLVLIILTFLFFPSCYYFLFPLIHHQHVSSFFPFSFPTGFLLYFPLSFFFFLSRLSLLFFFSFISFFFCFLVFFLPFSFFPLDHVIFFSFHRIFFSFFTFCLIWIFWLFTLNPLWTERFLILWVVFFTLFKPGVSMTLYSQGLSLRSFTRLSKCSLPFWCRLWRSNLQLTMQLIDFEGSEDLHCKSPTCHILDFV